MSASLLEQVVPRRAGENHSTECHDPMGLDQSLAPSLEAAQGARRLIVFSDDWGRHPSSCQHLVRHLLDDCDVTWINTIGTRAPRFNAATVRRGLEKLAQWRRPKAQVPAGPAPRVVSPIMWPGFRTGWQRRLNAHLLGRCLRQRIGDIRDAVVLTTIPIVADVVGTVPVQRWVYFCVDDFSVWPGLDSSPLRELEAKLIVRADRVIAAGKNLADRLVSLGRKPDIITHGIDLEHWQQRKAPDEILANLPRPIVLFWGLIDRRLDISYLQSLASRMTNGTIALVGPEQDPDPALDAISCLRRLGPVTYDRLPAVAAGADVLVMPYADLPVTRAMEPLKLKEYLATGKPVVSSPLPAVKPWADCLDIADRPDEFTAFVLERIRSGLAEPQEMARRSLATESWQAKAAVLRRLLFES